MKISPESIKSKHGQFIYLYRETHEEWPHYFYGHIVEPVALAMLNEEFPDDSLEIHSSEHKYAQWENSDSIDGEYEYQKLITYSEDGPNRFPVTEVWAFENL